LYALGKVTKPFRTVCIKQGIVEIRHVKSTQVKRLGEDRERYTEDDGPRAAPATGRLRPAQLGTSGAQGALVDEKHFI
jgi:hypothetical protein